jgi:hypothetical protein
VNFILGLTCYNPQLGISWVILDYRKANTDSGNYENFGYKYVHNFQLGMKIIVICKEYSL